MGTMSGFTPFEVRAANRLANVIGGKDVPAESPKRTGETSRTEENVRKVTTHETSFLGYSLVDPDWRIWFVRLIRVLFLLDKCDL